jgi:hypothetical protein
LSGWDLKLDVKSQVYNEFYLQLGYEYNPISGKTEGNGPNRYYSKEFSYYLAGVGYFITDNAFLELNFSKPWGNNIYGYNRDTSKLFKLNDRLEIGVGWNFDY